LLVRRGRRSGLFTMVAVHSTARGPALGGCRMWTYDDSRAAVRDVLRLSRAMTFKAAVAGLPLGGGKGVIMLRPEEASLTPERREAVLQDFGDTVDALDGAYLTAEDVGTSEPDMEVISGQTKHVTGLASGSGDPSPWTALGCEVTIRVTCERAFGTDDVSGRRIAVIGLGSVGGRLAEMLHEGGAELVVADVDQS
jgi:leucine dehydrogenase